MENVCKYFYSLKTSGQICCFQSVCDHSKWYKTISRYAWYSRTKLTGVLGLARFEGTWIRWESSSYSEWGYARHSVDFLTTPFRLSSSSSSSEYFNPLRFFLSRNIQSAPPPRFFVVVVVSTISHPLFSFKGKNRKACKQSICVFQLQLVYQIVNGIPQVRMLVPLLFLNSLAQSTFPQMGNSQDRHNARMQL